MATLREYYEKDFENCVKVYVSKQIDNQVIEGLVLYDFIAHVAYTAWFVEEKQDLKFYISFLKSLNYGSQITFEKKVTLPKGKTFPGMLHLENIPDSIFEIKAKFYGEPEYISSNEITSSRRLFIYANFDLTEDDKVQLINFSKELGHALQFRSNEYRTVRSNQESPLAFISHDWNDKEKVAKPIALALQKLLCPVWYDEFSLKVGNNLRESIEKGLKECKKCVLILSPNFMSNDGWTKTEFDSIFTRQILEKEKLVLPVWYNVTTEQVYEYSPSLLNVVGLDWNKLGEQEVCRQLYNEIF